MNTRMTEIAWQAGRRPLTRRTLVGGGLAGAAAWGLEARSTAARWPVPIEGPGGWRTWLLASGADLRPVRPPAPTPAEGAELLALQARRTEARRAAIATWDGGPAVLPWTAVALELIKAHKPSPPRAARALALLHVAAHDAAVAAWDAKSAHPRPAPVASIPELAPLAEATDGSSFPSEHAAVAGAAARALAHAFPEAASRLTELEEEAAASRLWAGAAYRSDVEAGLALGRAVGDLAAAWGRTDGSAAVWDGARPTGEGAWQPTPPDYRPDPLEPLAGAWRTWVLPNGDALRPAAPPAWGSPIWEAELLAVQAAVAHRTPAQAAAAEFWAGYAGTVTPAGLWIEIARDLIRRDGLDTPHAARVLALTSVAMYDAFVCCWDAKYAYWSARPVTSDPGLDVLFATPPFPSYTSGHSTISAAAAAVLGHLFPADEADLAARAREAKDSRLWAGIHYPIDNDVGATGGAQVGRLVVALAAADDL